MTIKYDKDNIPICANCGAPLKLKTGDMFKFQLCSAGCPREVTFPKDETVEPDPNE